MKVMARVGQLKSNKDGVPAEGGRRGRRRRIVTHGCTRRKVVFCMLVLDLRQEIVFQALSHLDDLANVCLTNEKFG